MTFMEEIKKTTALKEDKKYIEAIIQKKRDIYLKCMAEDILKELKDKMRAAANIGRHSVEYCPMRYGSDDYDNYISICQRPIIMPENAERLYDYDRYSHVIYAIDRDDFMDILNTRFLDAGLSNFVMQFEPQIYYENGFFGKKKRRDYNKQYLTIRISW